MKSFSEWKNEQLRRKLAEEMMSAAPVPSVPTTVNGDPNNAIPQNGNPMMPAQQPMAQTGMKPKPRPNPMVANQPKPGMPQPRPGMGDAQTAPGAPGMQQQQPDPKEFFGNTRFAPHIRQKLVNRQNAQGEPL